MFLHIKETDSAIETDEKNAQTFARISKLYRILSMLMHSQFAQMLAKLPRIKGAFTKTNVLKKNPNYRKIAKLLEFLRSYDNIGYTIRIVEQNPEVNETLQRDIFHNILFNYVVLKGYLQDEEDRQVSVSQKAKSRTLKPKFIKQIIEELTEDYDLPDVEVRKVLIEELTKADLMKEESAERHRLVEEQRQRKKAEEERIRQEKAAEKERIRREKEAEKERIRLEKEKEEQRLLQERMEREAEDRRRSGLIKKDLANFSENLLSRLEGRKELAAQQQQVMERVDFSDAVILMDEEEARRREENARLRKQRQEELELRRREEELARIRREEAAERARIAAEEEERRAMELQRQHDLQVLQPVIWELERFQEIKAKQLRTRFMKTNQLKASIQNRT